MSLQAAFSDLREAINSINRYRTIFEHPPLGTLTDKLGTIKIIKSESTEWGSFGSAGKRRICYKG